MLSVSHCPPPKGSSSFWSFGSYGSFVSLLLSLFFFVSLFCLSLFACFSLLVSLLLSLFSCLSLSFFLSFFACLSRSVTLSLFFCRLFLLSLFFCLSSFVSSLLLSLFFCLSSFVSLFLPLSPLFLSFFLRKTIEHLRKHAQTHPDTMSDLLRRTGLVSTVALDGHCWYRFGCHC